jgi:hypothetical protein
MKKNLIYLLLLVFLSCTKKDIALVKSERDISVDEKIILFEKDYPNKCNYDKIINTLRAKGFTQLKSGFHEVWRK